MLCLTRKFGESILLSGGVTIYFDAVPNNSDDVKVSIQAPPWIRVARGELGIVPYDPLAEAVNLLREQATAMMKMSGPSPIRVENKVGDFLAQYPEAK